MSNTDLTLDRIIDLVLSFLANHRAAAVAGLFGEATDDYQAEWLAREPLAFWGHLDLGNRRRLIALAVAHYGYAPTPPSTRLTVFGHIAEL